MKIKVSGNARVRLSLFLPLYAGYMTAALGVDGTFRLLSLITFTVLHNAH